MAGYGYQGILIRTQINPQIWRSKLAPEIHNIKILAEDPITAPVFFK